MKYFNLILNGYNNTLLIIKRLNMIQELKKRGLRQRVKLLGMIPTFHTLLMKVF